MGSNLLKTLVFMSVATASHGATFEERAAAVIQAHAAQIQPLEKKTNLAWWDANVSGQDADFKKKEEAQNAYDEKLTIQELTPDSISDSESSVSIFQKYTLLSLAHNFEISNYSQLATLKEEIQDYGI